MDDSERVDLLNKELSDLEGDLLDYVKTFDDPNLAAPIERDKPVQQRDNRTGPWNAS